jgi:two-component system, NarL family, response regulator NreC
MSEGISIVLADDHEVVRKGIRALLEFEPGFTVAGEASDGLEVADLVEQVRPDVLVVDLMMPGLGGLDVIRQVRQRRPRTRMVVLSMHSSEPFVIEALRSGALGYVLKDASTGDLVRAIREAMLGRYYLSPPLSDRAVELYSKKARATPDPFDELTPRERQILQSSAEGHTSREIAERLGISVRTAETHRSNLRRKLGFHTHAELVRYAVGRGMLPPAPLSRGGSAGRPDETGATGARRPRAKGARPGKA